MGKPRRLKFDDLAPRAWAVVGDWAKKWGAASLPVPLHEMAEAYKVRRIKFEPLLSTAGLEDEDDGYVVSVNTEAAGATQMDGTVLELSAETCLSLPTPLRFTLAHELAHLVLLQEAGDPVDIFSEHETELETLCNNLAGAILLPKSHFLRDIGVQLLDALSVKEAFKNYRVSPEVGVMRIHSPDLQAAELNASFGDLDGILALLEAQNAGIVVVATYIRGTWARQRWRSVERVSEQVPAENLHLHPDVLARIAAAEANREKADVVWHPVSGQTIPCELNSCRLYSSPLRILLAIRIIGDPEVTRQPRHIR